MFHGSNPIIISWNNTLCIYTYIYFFIPTDDWVRPMKHFVLEEIYI